MDWYYAINGQQQGPVPEKTIRELAATGGIGPDDLVWNADMGGEWARAASVAGLFGEAAASTRAGTGGSTLNRDLMRQARECLTGNWGAAALAFLVMFAITSAASWIPGINIIAMLLITGPLNLGVSILFLGVARGNTAEVGRIFDGFKWFGTALLAYFLMSLFVFLWSILLVIPGIVASLSYSMTYFIMADNPGITAMDAIGRSKEMMLGSRWRLFCLYCRFIGWFLLVIFLTFGVGMLWLGPYMQTSLARFYDDLAPEQAV
ncbi:MAG: DUF975 family protein [Lentisphaerae bacterium]|nr:DUF975 family protein [Lentisphaerota bacterium]